MKDKNAGLEEIFMYLNNYIISNLLDILEKIFPTEKNRFKIIALKLYNTSLSFIHRYPAVERVSISNSRPQIYFKHINNHHSSPESYNLTMISSIHI